MPVPKRRISLLLAASVLVAAVGGCSSSTAQVANTTVVAVELHEPAIAVLPVVEHLDAESGKPLENPPDDAGALAVRLQQAAVAELAGKGIGAVIASEAQTVADAGRTPARLYADLRALRSRPASGVFESGLGAQFGNRTLLATRVRFYEGPSGSWNINTGQITSAIERMVVDAHFYDLDTGREVWRQTVQLRTSPSISDSKLRDVVTRLFSTLTTNQ